MADEKENINKEILKGIKVFGIIILISIIISFIVIKLINFWFGI